MKLEEFEQQYSLFKENIDLLKLENPKIDAQSLWNEFVSEFDGEIIYTLQVKRLKLEDNSESTVSIVNQDINLSYIDLLGVSNLLSDQERHIKQNLILSLIGENSKLESKNKKKSGENGK